MHVLAFRVAAIMLLVAGCASPASTDDTSAHVADSPATTTTTTPPAESSDAAESSGGASDGSTTTTAAPDRSATTVPETVPPSTDSHTVGEVPTGLLEQIIADALGKSGANPEQVVVTRSEAALWEDGSLGCPEPGVTYTQAPVKGYWVELDVAGEHFDYRSTENGSFRRCTGIAVSSPTG